MTKFIRQCVVQLSHLETANTTNLDLFRLAIFFVGVGFFKINKGYSIVSKQCT